MDVKSINFKQPKYMLPAILYPILIAAGYPITNMFSIETADKTDPRLKTTEYLSSDLPEAHTDSLLGDKMANSQDAYGNISDFTGVENVEDDRDSLNRKEEYDSKYSDKEASVVKQQQRQYRDQLELRKMQNQVRENRQGDDGSGFVSPVTSSDIERVQRKRRQREWEEMNRDLGGSGAGYGSPSGQMAGSTMSGAPGASGIAQGGTVAGSQQPIGYDANGMPIYGNPQGATGQGQQQGSGEPGQEETQKVTKKTKETSSYFNTVGVGKKKANLITAIIDEDIKAVDGSRVRLRLLDDITIGEETVPKGTYLYVTMSGFSQQRVQGRIESIFFNEEIMKVSLTLYDTDGIEGLYVPQSSFRETKKDVLQSATSGGNNLIDNSSSGTGIKSWATQTVTNASQRVMQALGTAAKKNRVKLKYGTRVYLMDTSAADKKKENRN